MGCGSSTAAEDNTSNPDLSGSIGSQNPTLAASSAFGVAASPREGGETSTTGAADAAGTGASAPAALDAAAREALQDAALAAAAAGGTTLVLSQPESRDTSILRLPVLTSVPSAVWALRHLTALDLSGQNLTELAPQLGASARAAAAALRSAP